MDSACSTGAVNGPDGGLTKYLSDAGEAFLYRLMGVDNFNRWMECMNEGKFENPAHFIGWLLDVAQSARGTTMAAAGGEDVPAMALAAEAVNESRENVSNNHESNSCNAILANSTDSRLPGASDVCDKRKTKCLKNSGKYEESHVPGEFLPGSYPRELRATEVNGNCVEFFGPPLIKEEPSDETDDAVYCESELMGHARYFAEDLPSEQPRNAEDIAEEVCGFADYTDTRAWENAEKSGIDRKRNGEKEAVRKQTKRMKEMPTTPSIYIPPIDMPTTQMHLPGALPPRVTCPLCARSFVSESNLKSHHQMVHLQYRPFVCPRCKTSFKKRCHLNRHLNAKEPCISSGIAHPQSASKVRAPNSSNNNVQDSKVVANKSPAHDTTKHFHRQPSSNSNNLLRQSGPVYSQI